MFPTDQKLVFNLISEEAKMNLMQLDSLLTRLEKKFESATFIRVRNQVNLNLQEQISKEFEQRLEECCKILAATEQQENLKVSEITDSLKKEKTKFTESKLLPENIILESCRPIEKHLSDLNVTICTVKGFTKEIKETIEKAAQKKRNQN